MTTSVHEFASSLTTKIDKQILEIRLCQAIIANT